MKKLLLSLVAILALAGVALAANIPSVVDPQNGPETWLTAVYNNSGSTLDVGDVVVWDIGSSTGDDDNYVTTTTTASTQIVAGVVYPAAIAAASTGSIAIKGIATCDVNSVGANAMSPLCTSTTGGSGTPCTATVGQYAITTAAISPSSSGNCFVK